MTIEKWALLDSVLVFGHRWYQLRRDTVRLPDGTVVDDYFVSVRPEVAMVFPLTPDGDVIFVRQYKHGAQAITIELPGGTFRHELPEDAARRELIEETGYTPGELIPLGWIWEDPTRKALNERPKRCSRCARLILLQWRRLTSASKSYARRDLYGVVYSREVAFPAQIGKKRFDFCFLSQGRCYSVTTFSTSIMADLRGEKV